MPQNTTRRCGICNQFGHNRRTCTIGKTKNVVKPVESTIDEPIATDSCPICMESIGKTNCVTTECRHTYCLPCFLTHCKTNNKCPLCRTEIAGAADTDWKTRYSNLADYTSFIETENGNLISENNTLRQQVNQVLSYLDSIRPEQ